MLINKIHIEIDRYKSQKTRMIIHLKYDKRCYCARPPLGIVVKAFVKRFVLHNRTYATGDSRVGADVLYNL